MGISWQVNEDFVTILWQALEVGIKKARRELRSPGFSISDSLRGKDRGNFQGVDKLSVRPRRFIAPH